MKIICRLKSFGRKFTFVKECESRVSWKIQLFVVKNKVTLSSSYFIQLRALRCHVIGLIIASACHNRNSLRRRPSCRGKHRFFHSITLAVGYYDVTARGIAFSPCTPLIASSPPRRACDRLLIYVP